MKHILEQQGIEYRSDFKYYTKCPKCSHTRKKKDTKSLLVFKTESFARVKCYHAESCDWNSFRIFTNKDVAEPEESMDAKFKPFPSDIELPIDDTDTKYTYKDTQGNILFYIIRPIQKSFFPLAYGDDGSLYLKRPKFKTLYRAEYISDDVTRPIVVVEGEKAADAASTIFKKADIVTWVGGAANIYQGDWSLLKGRQVILWPDNDQPGIEAMYKISKMIDSSQIFIVDVSKLPPKSDLADDIPTDLIKQLFLSKVNIATPPVKDSLKGNKFLEKLKDVKSGIPLGFGKMDKIIRAPQSGLVIVEGRSGHGKTSFMINVVKNMLKTQPDRPIVYLSYEIPAVRVLLKLVMCMEGKEFSEVAYLNEELYREKTLKGELESYKYLESVLDSKLFITDADMDIKEIVKTLDCDRFKDAIVLVDYIQLIPSKSAVNRYLVIKEFADNLRLVANKRNQVILTGCQLTRGETPYQDQAREGKDITNAAELVLKIWNKVVAEAHDEVMKNKDGDITHYYEKANGDFIIDVKKNRNGEMGKQFGFDFKFGTVIEERNLKTEF